MVPCTARSSSTSPGEGERIVALAHIRDLAPRERAERLVPTAAATRRSSDRTSTPRAVSLGQRSPGWRGRGRARVDGYCTISPQALTMKNGAAIGPTLGRPEPGRGADRDERSVGRRRVTPRNPHGSPGAYPFQTPTGFPGKDNDVACGRSEIPPLSPVPGTGTRPTPHTLPAGLDRQGRPRPPGGMARSGPSRLGSRAWPQGARPGAQGEPAPNKVPFCSDQVKTPSGLVPHAPVLAWVNGIAVGHAARSG